MLGTKQKYATDVLDFDLDYADWITPGDTILTVTTSVLPAAVLLVDSAQIASPQVKVWLSGGVADATYEVFVTAATAGGRVKIESFKVRVKGL